MNPDELKDCARRFFAEIWNGRDESAIDRFIVPEAGGNDPDFGAGKEAFRAQWKQWMAAFPDLHFEIVELLAEGNKVLTRWVLTGTQRCSILGVDPAGTKIRVEGISLDRIENGLVMEGLRRLGRAFPTPPTGLYDGA